MPRGTKTSPVPEDEDRDQRQILLAPIVRKYKDVEVFGAFAPDGTIQESYKVHAKTSFKELGDMVEKHNYDFDIWKSHD